MGMYVSTTFLFCVAFVMIFTYAAEGIIFLENERIDNQIASISSITDVTNSSLLTFDQFLSVNFEKALEIERTGEIYMNFGHGDWNSWGTIDSMIGGLRNGKSTINAWWDSIPDLKYAGVLGKDTIRAEYNSCLMEKGYSMENGVIKKTRTNLLDDAFIFLGKIGDAIGKFFELLTFSIKDHYGVNVIPSPVMYVLNLFFIPLWIVIGVEALPILVSLVEAIGSLLDAILPDWL